MIGHILKLGDVGGIGKVTVCVPFEFLETLKCSLKHVTLIQRSLFSSVGRKPKVKRPPFLKIYLSNPFKMRTS
jgi:hypothetical protein